MLHSFFTSKDSMRAITNLKNSFEFNVLFKDGIRVNHDNICIHAISLDRFKHKLQHSRHNRLIYGDILLGFSISKKVAKSAKRNLVRRRIRAIFISLSKEMLIRNIAFALVCRKGILEWDFQSLKQYIISSIHKINKLLTNPNKQLSKQYSVSSGYRQSTKAKL